MNTAAYIYALKKILSFVEADKKDFKQISRELIEPQIELFEKEKKTGLTVIQSDEIEDFRDEAGFYKVDFGSNIKLNTYLDGDNVHIFSYKGTSRETLPLVLISKDELSSFFGILKKEATYDVLAEHLNTLVDDNKLSVKKGAPFLAASRNKDLDIDLAIENLSLDDDSQLWVQQIELLSTKIKNLSYSSNSEKKQLETIAKNMLNKISTLYAESDESPYVSWRKGKESFDPETIEPFIQELEEKNIEVAIKITREGGTKPKLTIKNCFSIDEIQAMDKIVLNFLKFEYQKKNDYLAEKENKKIANDQNEPIVTTALKL